MGNEGLLVHNTYGLIEKAPSKIAGKFKFLYTNPKGFTFEWPERTMNEIRQSIAKRALGNDGDKLEALVAQFVDSQGKLVEAGKKIMRTASKQPAGDIDVEAISCIIECKKTVNAIGASINPDGTIKPITQFLKYFDTNNVDFINPDNKQVVIFLGEKINSITSPNEKKILQWLKDNGVKVIDDLYDLPL